MEKLKIPDIYVSVFASTGQEYLGKLKMYSITSTDKEREVAIIDPEIVKRNADGKITKTSLGSEGRTTYAMFTSSDIKRVIFHWDLYEKTAGSHFHRFYRRLIRAEALPLVSILVIIGFVSIVFIVWYLLVLVKN